jgi:hypothetical protein
MANVLVSRFVTDRSLVDRRSSVQGLTCPVDLEEKGTP